MKHVVIARREAPRQSNLNKLVNLARDVILLLVFFGLAAKETHLLALTFLIPLAAPGFFIILGVLAFASAISTLRKVGTNNMLQVLSPLAATLGCALVVFHAYTGLAFPAFTVPALFALAFTCGSISASKAIFPAFKNIQPGLVKMFAILNFASGLTGLIAVVLALLLPAISVAILPLSPVLMASLLIMAGVFRFAPIINGYLPIFQQNPSMVTERDNTAH